MTASTGTQMLDITALGIPIHGLPGPALLGESGAQIVISVSRGDGSPVAHLASATFQIEEVVLHRARSATASDSILRTLSVAAFGEPRDGLYTLLVCRRDGASLERGAHAILVSVQDPGRARGQALVRLDA